MSYKAFYSLAVFSYVFLFMILLYWAVVFAAEDGLPTSLRIILFAGPLLLTLRGLLNHNRSSLTWTGFLALGYFTFGIVEIYSNSPAIYLATTVTGISLGLFACIIMMIRSLPTQT
jgi:uncharacterized membrane protein